MGSLSSTIFLSLSSSSSFRTNHYHPHQRQISPTIPSSSTQYPHLSFPFSSFSLPPPSPPPLPSTTNSNPSSRTRTTCSSSRRINPCLRLTNHTTNCFQFPAQSLFGSNLTTTNFLNCNARTAIISAMGNSKGRMAGESSVVVVRGMIRFVVAVVACTCVMFVSWCQRAVAAENTKGGLILVKELVGPKTIQVLHVLKDQGLILAALLGLSAFFSMAETAITTLWPWKVRELAEKEPENGVFRMLRSDVTRFLTTILIGTTVLNIAATALVTEAATTIFGEAGVSAATGVMTVAILLLTEITPKSIAVHNATEVARFVARPVAWLSIVLYPVGRVVTFLSMGMLKMLGLKGRSEPYVTEDELKLMLRGAELSGAIEEEEQDMIENVLEIKDTHVREVMTPLVDVVAIDASATLIDFQKSWESHQYSRVPVFEERIDNIIGIAYAMDMLEYVGKVEKLKEATVREIAHPTYFVPDSMSVWNLLREFRIRKVHMAVVLNEYGGTVGIVTLEDVVEEIVGEIFDENDSKEEIQKKTGYIVMQEDGTFDVDANTSIDQLSEELDVKIAEGHQYETVSGFICESFGYIPEEGAKMVVLLERAGQEESNEYAGTEPDNHDEKAKHQTFEIEVLEANERKVGKVRFKPMNDGGNPDLENNKGLSRLLSTKVVKRKKQQNNREMEEPDGNNHTADRLEEGSCSNVEGRLEDDSSCSFDTVEKGDGYNIVSRQ